MILLARFGHEKFPNSRVTESTNIFYDFIRESELQDLVLVNTQFTCLSSSSFPIMVNGMPRARFGVSRGLRHGNPLSPFFFTLVVDVFSRTMDKAVRNNIVEDFKVGGEEILVSYLQFGNDT